MGQGISVTPLQMLRAICVVANGGSLVKPHLLRQIQAGPLERASYELDPVRRQILKTQTALWVKDMMTDVVTEGTGKTARLEGFTAAGKTGTAQKVENKVYSHSKFIASFAGFAPLKSPVIAVVVTIDEPKGQYFGGDVAAPVFRAIAEKTLRYLSVAPDQPLTPAQMAQLRPPPGATEGKEPDLGFDALAAAGKLMSKNSPLPEQSLIPEAHEAPAAEVPGKGDWEGYPGVEVPDLTGKSMRAALTEIAGVGLEMQVRGSGMAVLQMPAAHARVARGSKVMVQFSRRLN
jgi:stage V sporulation protein D (sporulation-specific penicillin-binding protein)